MSELEQFAKDPRVMGLVADMAAEYGMSGDFDAQAGVRLLEGRVEAYVSFESPQGTVRLVLELPL